MNWLDGIIGFISPEWGARREAWRQSLTEMRNYDAGNYDRGNANWRVLNQSAEFTDRYNRDNVRARARDLERNSDMMNSVIGAYKPLAWQMKLSTKSLTTRPTRSSRQPGRNGARNRTAM